MAEAKTKTPRPRRTARRKAVEELARSYFEAFGRRDPEAMGDHWSSEGIDDIVPLAVLRGVDEIKSFLREFLAAVPDAQTTVSRVVADESRAAVEWRTVGTFDGAAFQGIDPTGRHVEIRGLDLLEIEDGKIVRNTAYYDGMAFARTIGLMPPQDSGAERAMKGAFNAVTKLRKAVNERRTG